MAISIRKLKLEDVIKAERLIMRAVNDLRQRNNLEPFPYKKTHRRNPMIVHFMNSDPDGSYGAFSGNRMVGYGCAFVRDNQWYLANLHVDPQFQGKRIGKRLIKKTLKIGESDEVDTFSLCTFAYNPMAIALYTSFGMPPIQTLPCFQWDKPKKKRLTKIKNEIKLRAVPIEDYEQIEILNKLDKPNRGVYRPEDHKFWLDSENVKGNIYYQGRKLIGYSLLFRNMIIGPVCARSPRYLIPLLIESINNARANDSEKLIFWISGNNSELLRFALQSKFRITETELLMSNRMFYRDTCYIPAPLAVF